jgi:hypothetical protein
MCNYICKCKILIFTNVYIMTNRVFVSIAHK